MRLMLDKRLLSCAGFVRQDALFADIGTDHAYLPIFLLKEGRIKSAVCADINEGPLNSARENLKENGLLDRAQLVLTNGLSGLEGTPLTDIAICGMGGELIRDIIKAAPFVKDEKINLILQPMSRVNVLREFLLSEGFYILDDSYVKSGGKCYVTMLVSYSGKAQKADEYFNYFGTLDANKVSNNPAAYEYARGIVDSLQRACLGKARAGQDDASLGAFIAYAKEKLFGEIK